MARRFKKYCVIDGILTQSKRGAMVYWDDVAPYIKEARPTASNKLKAEIAAQLCGASVFERDGFVIMNFQNYNKLRQLSAV